MTTLMFVSIRVQHRDSIEIRTLVTEAGKENRDLIEQAVSKLSAAFEEHQRVAAQNHDIWFCVAVSESLRDARERLARIEGRLGPGGTATQDSGPGGTATQDSGIGGTATQDSGIGGTATQDSGIGGTATQDSGIGGTATQDSGPGGDGTEAA